MEFLDSIKQTYKRSLDFTGRTGRSEFWWFKLYFWGGLFISVSYTHLRAHET